MTKNVTIRTLDGMLYGNCGDDRQRASPISMRQGVVDAFDYGPRAIQPPLREPGILARHRFPDGSFMAHGLCDPRGDERAIGATLPHARAKDMTIANQL